jgi:RecA/RadA recombinase
MMPRTRKTTKTEVEETAQAPGFASADQTYTMGQLSDDEFTSFRRISTGVVTLDFVTGGGYPRGVLTQLHGKDKSGKTALSIFAAGEALADPNDWVLFLDSEGHLTGDFSKLVGLTDDQLRRLTVVRTSVLEDVLAIMKAALTHDVKEIGGGKGPVAEFLSKTERPPSLIIWDSVASCVATKDYEADMAEGVGYPEAPKVLSRRLAPILAWMRQTDTPIIVTNHFRNKLTPGGGAGEQHFPGGNFLRHSHVLRLYAFRTIEKHDAMEQIGRHTVEVTKSKISGDGMQGDFLFSTRTGYDRLEDVLSMGRALGMVTAKGGGYNEWNGVSFRRVEFADKIGAQIGELVESIRTTTGIPHLGGVSLDRWVERLSAGEKDTQT